MRHSLWVPASSIDTRTAFKVAADLESELTDSNFVVTSKAKNLADELRLAARLYLGKGRAQMGAAASMVRFSRVGETIDRSDFLANAEG